MGMQAEISLLLKLTEIFNKNYFLKNFKEIFYDIADVKKNASIAGGILVRGLRNLPNQIDIVHHPCNIVFTVQPTNVPEHRITLENLLDFRLEFRLV